MAVRRRDVASAVALAATLLGVRSRGVQHLDRRAGRALARPLGPAADAAISAATDLGSVFAIAGLSATLAAAGRRRTAARVAGAGATGWIAAQAVKGLVDRPRPYQADGMDRLVTPPSGSSWPSGHVAVAAAMGSAVASDLPRTGKAGAGLLAGFVAYSRIYVGVHYVSDVVAGLGLGVLSDRLWRGLSALGNRLRSRVGSPS